MVSEPLRVYDLVRVKEPHPDHFPTGEAIISGRSVDGFKLFTLFFENRGEVSWYESEDLELVRRHQTDVLDQWEKAVDEKARHDLYGPENL